MGLLRLFDIALYGTFKCDNCKRPHPRKKRTWSNTSYPGLEFGSKKCLIEYERAQKVSESNNRAVNRGTNSDLLYSNTSKTRIDGHLASKGGSKMGDNNIILEKVLEAFRDQGFAQVEGYNRFGYLRETDNAVYVERETGKDTRVGFEYILSGIEALQDDHTIYSAGPSSLRKYDITHVTSPVWAILHLLPLSAYRNQ